MTPYVPAIKQSLVKALQAALSVDPSVLPSSQAATLKKAIDSIEKAISSVDQLAALLPVATEILGGNGPRTYLIEQVTPAELRAGGGFIGSVSVITADLGQVKLTMGGGIETWEYPRPNKYQSGYVVPPGPLQSFIGDSSFGLADSNFYPDFRTSAGWAETFAQSEMHIKPDGVIAIDPDVVAALLNVTGPLKVPGYNVTVDAGTFTDWLFQQQYALKNVTSTKKAIFSAIASELIPRVTSLPPSRWPDLMTQLNNMASQRHIQVYFNNAAAEKVMDQYGWSGALNPRQTSDLVYEVESNFGATKANHFVSRSYTLDLSASSGLLHHVMTIAIKNAEPAGYEGGNNYNGYFRLYVPADATSLHRLLPLTQQGLPDNTVPKEYQVFEGWFEIDNRYAGRNVRTLKFSWDTPWSDPSGTHSIYWQKQPGTGNERVAVTWTSGGSRYSATGDLAADREIVLAPGSVVLKPGLAGTAKVPSLTL
jgi:hypothetical protein